jgi:Fe-Mn family superoxide dismutase
MSNIKKLLDVSDLVDQAGLTKEADAITEVIESLTKTAKKGFHKCGLKDETVQHHEELLESYEKSMKHFEGEYKKVMRSNNEKDTPNMGKLREITQSYAHNCNAVRFHTMYMDDVVNSRPYSIDKDTQMKAMLKELYDSNQMTHELNRMAKIPRSGWVVMNYCLITKKLYLSVVDLHDQHVVACAVPVMALDMWEHAYFNDFGSDKEAYIDWFLGRMDWRNVRKRIKNYQRVK